MSLRVRSLLPPGGDPELRPRRQYRVPFVTVPYLMSASQFDRYQLPVRLRLRVAAQP